MQGVMLKDWKQTSDGKVILTYEDGSVLYVKKSDFDRAFGAIVSAPYSAIKEEFAID